MFKYGLEIIDVFQHMVGKEKIEFLLTEEEVVMRKEMAERELSFGVVDGFVADVNAVYFPTFREVLPEEFCERAVSTPEIERFTGRREIE